MSVYDAISKRRSVRNYKPDAIPEDVLNKLLNAIRLAPSGGNQQPYKFIVVQDKEIKAKLAAACRWTPGAPKGHAFIDEAPVAIVACGSDKGAISRFYFKEGEVTLAPGQGVPAEIDRSPGNYHNLMDIDVAIAVDHLILAATEEGLGTCWVAAINEQEVKKVLSVPDDMRVLVVIPVGYTDSWPEPRPRKSLEELICYDKWS